MTKAEFITEIAKINQVDESIVLPIVDSFMKTIKHSLSRNENVYLRGFGSFIIKRRAEKKARNISQNTYVIVPAHKLPAFKPAVDFMQRIK